jgi:hypothetical protein
MTVTIISAPSNLNIKEMDSINRNFNTNSHQSLYNSARSKIAIAWLGGHSHYGHNAYAVKLSPETDN